MDMETNDKNTPVLEELAVSRLFEAPREVVWKAWTDPEIVKRWWGPKDFTAPEAKIDLRVGGEYLFCMRSPDGQDFWSKGVYQEVVEPEELAMTDSFADEKGNVVPASYYGLSAAYPLELAIHVTFDEEGGKTRLTVKQFGHPPGKDLENARAGWNETLDKLEEYLEGFLEGLA